MYLKDLKIYVIGVQLRDEIYKEIQLIPHNWAIDDIKQIKRSSASVPSNISEGFARRFYPQDYVRFLNIALGSSDETQNHISALFKGGHITQEKADYFCKKYKDLSIRICNLIVYLKNKYNLKTV